MTPVFCGIPEAAACLCRVERAVACTPACVLDQALRLHVPNSFGQVLAPLVEGSPGVSILRLGNSKGSA